ncbi:MAG: hemerythrin domain-containing protein [bacterium]
MLPIGPLMIEHRLIEKLVSLLPGAVQRMQDAGAPDARFIDDAVDFIRNYADHTHHGKEERILFRELAKKPLKPEHRAAMQQLTDEHAYGRTLTVQMVRAKDRWFGGETTALGDITDALAQLARFYPRHIEFEDKEFFIPVMDYFTPAEKDAMLAEGYEFDRKVVHDVYADLVERVTPNRDNTAFVG